METAVAGGHRQTVRPAGADRETRWVLLAALSILLVAATAVGLRQTPAETHALAAHQIDARTGLTPAEQGLFADLRAAAEDIAAQRTGNAPPPPVEALAAEGLPPFVGDASATARGDLAWTLRQDGVVVAYQGVSAAPEVAGSLLLLLGGHGAEVWLKRAAEAPASLDESALTAAGWRQVVSSFTAGVTR